MPIETKRLIINKFDTNDISAWALIECDPKVRKFVNNKVLTYGEAKSYVLENIESYKTNGYGRYAVRYKSNRRLIGMFGFLKDELGIDFGYRYSRDTWGQGIGTEAAQAIIKYGLTKVALRSIVAAVLPENIASEKILIKLGFLFEEQTHFMGKLCKKYKMACNSMRTNLITLALFATIGTQAYSIEECDILASLEADPSSVSSPVAFNDIQPRAVIDACTKAIAANDADQSRYLLHRARGYLKGGEGEKALLDLENAHKLGYPAATFGLATAYYLGDDITQNFEKARVLFIQAYENGVLWSAWGLSLLYSNEMYENYDLGKAKKWGVRFKNGY